MSFHTDYINEFDNPIIVARRVFGGPLPPGAQVHHQDCDPTNNKPSNLVICQDREYHGILHKRLNSQRFAHLKTEKRLRREFFGKLRSDPEVLAKLEDSLIKDGFIGRDVGKELEDHKQWLKGNLK